MMGRNVSKAERRRTGNLDVKRIACVAALIGALSGAFALPAGGDIYWFEDENGVVHMSNVPVDARFRFKEREPSDRRVTILPGKPRKGYDRLIDRVARSQGLDSALLRAVIETESNYDPDAVSDKGAVGLMQLMPETARRMGVTDPFHPAENLEAGARHLRRLIDKYQGRLTLALSAYNAGEKAVDRYKGIPPYPETQNYVKKVLEAYGRAAKERQALQRVGSR